MGSINVYLLIHVHAMRASHSSVSLGIFHDNNEIDNDTRVFQSDPCDSSISRIACELKDVSYTELKSPIELRERGIHHFDSAEARGSKGFHVSGRL